ncbi:MAG: PHP domain-containing protein [Candidatus Izemoplasma sp.]|nr:PHP domain-containing protein [Candidatus Izemoplasma sp.]
MKADLHMHTTFSDGRKTPEALINRAKAKGLDIIAITDHDTIQDVERIQELANQAGIRYIPGVELSTVVENISVHILGYFRDDSYNGERLQNYFRFIKEAREKRAKKIITRLQKYFDIEIEYDRVYDIASGIIARPHIAKAITEKYPEYTHDDIFDTMIGETCKAYVPTSELDVASGIKLLKDHNCLVVLAHPTLVKPQIKDKVFTYDFDGLEAKYYRNKPGEEDKFRSFAKENGMIITGGSDYHGIAGDTKHGDLGEVTLSGKDLDIFLKNIKKRG